MQKNNRRKSLHHLRHLLPCANTEGAGRKEGWLDAGTEGRRKNLHAFSNHIVAAT